MFTCKMCGTAGGSELFYETSTVRCRQCVNRLSRQRYQLRYKEQLRATRKAKDSAKKNRPVGLPEVERAYAAGLIDGEGSIRMSQRGKHGGTAFRVGQYTLMVEMTNTDKEMLEWLKERFGGTIAYLPESPKDNRRERWHWRIASNLALYCLDAVWPYIRTKRTQAKLGRRFQRYVQYTGTPATPKRQRLHERFYQEFRALNRRGIRNPED